MPTLGHMALVGLVKEGLVQAIISQNVDGERKEGTPQYPFVRLHFVIGIHVAAVAAAVGAASLVVVGRCCECGCGFGCCRGFPPPPPVIKHNFAGRSLRAQLHHDETWNKKGCVSDSPTALVPKTSLIRNRWSACLARGLNLT